MPLISICSFYLYRLHVVNQDFNAAVGCPSFRGFITGNWFVLTITGSHDATCGNTAHFDKELGDIVCACPGQVRLTASLPVESVCPDILIVLSGNVFIAWIILLISAKLSVPISLPPDGKRKPCADIRTFCRCSYTLASAGRKQ